ncbi:MAG: ATP-binding protein [Cyclobacteriaceae bacterium]
MKTTSILSFLLVLNVNLFVGFVSLAQTKYHLKTYSIEDGLGLERNFGRGITQDGLGFMWFDHDSHISRFDGYTFKIYRHDPDNELFNLEQPLIGRILTDNEGNLWINNLANDFSSGELLQYNRATGGFTKFNPAVKHLVNAIIFNGESNTTWLGTRNGGGLYEFNTVTGLTVNYPFKGKDEALTNHISAIEDQGSKLVLSTKNGIWLFDKLTKKHSRPNVNPKDTLDIYTGWTIKMGNKPWIFNQDTWDILELDSNFSIKTKGKLPLSLRNNRSMAIDNDHLFWVIIDSAICSFDPKTGHITTHYTNSLDHEFLSELTVDNENNIWFTSEKGINKLTRNYFDSYRSVVERGSPRTDRIQLIRNNGIDYAYILSGRSYSGAMWKTTIELAQVPIKPFQFSGANELGANLASSYLGKNYFWIAAYDAGVVGLKLGTDGLPLPTETIRFQNEANQPFTIGSGQMITVYEDNQGFLWAGGNSGLYKINLKKPYGTEGSVLKFLHDETNEKSLSSNLVRQIAPAGKDSLWIGTATGVDLFTKGEFHHVFKDRESVWFICTTFDGGLYIGTTGRLYKLTKAGNGYSLSKTIVRGDVDLGFVEDQLGRLWVSTQAGLAMYDPVAESVVNFGEMSGFMNIGGPIRTEEGIIAFCTDNGIMSFDPSSIVTSQREITPLLSKLEINNKAYDYSLDPKQPYILSITQLELDYLHNNFSIGFTTNSMTAPEQIHYRHRLEGYDKDWIDSDYKNRHAVYTNLDPGTYTLRVKASNHFGIWGETEKSLKVIILPPPWRTWWAYTGYSLLVIGLLIWARKNIVQRERLKSKLKLEHLELEKAKEVDRLKTSFFTNISHEFRTPLTLIKGPVQNLMEEFAENPKVKERLKLIERNSDLLLKLINQLLDLAKLESGSLKIEKSEANISTFIGAISYSFLSMAHNKNIELKLDLPPESSNAIFDKDKLETILINLINNAIKFTPEGGFVTVKAIVEKSRLLVTVKDNGIGIPKVHHEAIFQRFHQVNDAHKEVGTGIGLSLVKELAELMGGAIYVESEGGSGSEFKLVLPIEFGETVTDYPLPVAVDRDQETGIWAVATKLKPEEGIKTSKPQVLVVEDNTDLRKFIIDSLGNEFYFLEAADGKQGLDKAIENVPDLIICDVMMPKMDGIAMAGKLKGDVRTNHIPIIILTAKSTEDSKLSGLQKGVDDYLTKPFNKQELLLKVRNSINSRSKVREKMRLEMMKESPKVEVQSADEQFLGKVKEAIQVRLGEEQLSVESLSREIGLSRTQLYRKVTALTGVSVNELIRSFRLKKAAQLLEQNWGSVSQVAYEVGFSNLSYFSKVFKEEYGVLPSEYSHKTHEQS